MEINQLKKVKVNAKTLKIHVKCTDHFCGDLVDQDGEVIQRSNDMDGTVPGFFPGEHYGEYLILHIDLDTGTITNWEKPTAEQIENWIQEQQ